MLMILKTKKQKLKEWLQNFANSHKCHVCINSDYTPCIIAIYDNPVKKYDENDGYWPWEPQQKGSEFTWLDDFIPEKLYMAKFKLAGLKFSPENI